MWTGRGWGGDPMMEEKPWCTTEFGSKRIRKYCLGSWRVGVTTSKIYPIGLSHPSDRPPTRLTRTPYLVNVVSRRLIGETYHRKNRLIVSSQESRHPLLQGEGGKHGPTGVPLKKNTREYYVGHPIPSLPRGRFLSSTTSSTNRRS